MTSQSSLLISVLLGDAVVVAGTLWSRWLLRKAPQIPGPPCTSISDLQGGESPYRGWASRAAAAHLGGLTSVLPVNS